MANEIESQNPFAATSATPESRTAPREKELTGVEFHQRIGQLFIEWEKLRIAYNLILIVAAVLTIVPLLSISDSSKWDEYHTIERLVMACIGGAIGANVLYCFGHAVNSYLVLLKLDLPSAKWIFFILGTLLSILLAMIVLFYEMGPTIDLLPAQN